MKNIYILPTDKPSRLHYYNQFNGIDNYGLSKKYLQWHLGQHIYITSDEEIKEGDWFMSDFNSFPIHNIKELSERKGSLGWEQKDLKNNLKINLTTDQDLIKDGVQAIDDEFLEWFVNNPSFEFVEIERLEDGKYIDRFADGTTKEGVYENYKIIIPQEEPKQKTTIYGTIRYKERVYSEEDMKLSFEAGKKGYMRGSYLHQEYYFTWKNFKQWFEQFKKK
jgi:hypothetical protein